MEPRYAYPLNILVLYHPNTTSNRESDNLANRRWRITHLPFTLTLVVDYINRKGKMGISQHNGLWWREFPIR